jgi:hypothetical protein
MCAISSVLQTTCIHPNFYLEMKRNINLVLNATKKVLVSFFCKSLAKKVSYEFENRAFSFTSN